MTKLCNSLNISNLLKALSPISPHSSTENLKYTRIMASIGNKRSIQAAFPRSFSGCVYPAAWPRRAQRHGGPSLPHRTHGCRPFPEQAQRGNVGGIKESLPEGGKTTAGLQCT